MTQRLLAVFAHPDDESFGPGGTMARYAHEGVDVHIAIATDGVAGSVAPGFEGSQEELVAVRAQELVTAVNILGATLHTLNYRDSGYVNDPANDHPDAFINGDMAEQTGRVVQLIREIRPHVVITHNETGGYYHPDHIHCYKIVTAAFHAASDPAQYPEIGPVPWQPQRLYYTAFSNRMAKFFILMMRLRRQDPTKLGRNQDIDLTKLGVDPSRIGAVIDYRPYWDVRRAASAAHASQGGGAGGGFVRQIPVWLQKRFFGKDTYIRAYPPLENGHKDKDLFAGLGEE